MEHCNFSQKIKINKIHQYMSDQIYKMKNCRKLQKVCIQYTRYESANNLQEATCGLDAAL